MEDLRKVDNRVLSMKRGMFWGAGIAQWLDRVHLLTLVTNSIMFLVALFFFFFFFSSFFFFFFFFFLLFFFFFFFFGAESRKNIFHPLIVKMQMLIDFTVFFCSKKKRLLVNLAHFLKFIMSEF